MLHIVKWIRRHYGDQSDYMITVLVVLVVTAFLLGGLLLVVE